MKFKREKTPHNRGAALLMVILTTAFVITLGSSLLFNSHNVYLMKLVDRQGVSNFYSNEEVLDQIKARLQEVANDCLVEAHNYVSARYSSITSGASADEITRLTQEAFADRYLVNLDAYETEAGERLFRIDNASQVYSMDGLESLILEATGDVSLRVSDEGGSVPNDSALGVVGRVDVEEEPPATGADPIVVGMVLKDLQITYTNPDTKYTSHITTDISLQVPIYAYTGGSGGGYPFGNSAIISRDAMKLGENSDNNEINIVGDFYAGAIEVGTDKGSTITVNHSGGSWITGEDYLAPAEKTIDYVDVIQGLVIYKGNYKFNQLPGAELWTSQVTVMEGSDLTLAGDAYVMQDLTVSGGTSSNPSEITLGGSYFGFGSGGVAASALSSSAIVFNGNNIELDLSLLEDLKLAGSASLINPTTDSNGNVTGQQELIIGQSMATLPDQVAYLVPNEAMPNGMSNPTWYSSETEAESMKNIPVDTSVVLWGNKTVGDYASNQAYVMMKTFGKDGFLVYAFLDFNLPGQDSRTLRNSYYGDYYTNNKTEFLSYLAKYLTIKNEGSFTAVTEGYTYFNDPASDSELSTLYSDANDAQDKYDFIKKVIDESINDPNPETGYVPSPLHPREPSDPSRPENDPYYYYLKPPLKTISTMTDEVASHDYTMLREEAMALAVKSSGNSGIMKPLKFYAAGTDHTDDDDVLALYLPFASYLQDYSIASDAYIDAERLYDNLKFIIVGDSIQVNQDFDGLIMSAKHIGVYSILTSDSLGIDAAMEAVHINHKGEEVALKEYFQNLETTRNNGSSTNSMTWKLSDLVVYENWEKQ